jgi:hypothetical protein
VGYGVYLQTEQVFKQDHFEAKFANHFFSIRMEIETMVRIIGCNCIGLWSGSFSFIQVMRVLQEKLPDMGSFSNQLKQSNGFFILFIMTQSLLFLRGDHLFND